MAARRTSLRRAYARLVRHAVQITQDMAACLDEGQLIPPLRPSFKFGCVGYDWTAAEDAHVVLLHFHFHGLGKQISYAVQHADGRAPSLALACVSRVRTAALSRCA